MLIDSATVVAREVAAGFLVPMQERPPPPGQLPEWGSAAPVGLAVVLVLLLATAFLIRNMSTRITRLPESFDIDSADTGRADTDGADTARADTARADTGRARADSGGVGGRSGGEPAERDTGAGPRST
ncbi:hypothetical protein [Pseudonocardia sp. NPDC049635]|uniref:hypothetical protein n=1 Tax=Pseudonocardia sp. NPDC049635 TaxID=3155506 RepID=UPI0033E51B9D